MSSARKFDFTSPEGRRPGDAEAMNSAKWMVYRGQSVWGRYPSKIHRVAHGGRRTVCGVNLGKQTMLRRGTWAATCETCLRQNGPSYMGIREAGEDAKGNLTGETHYLWPKRKVTQEDIDAALAKFEKAGGIIKKLEPVPDPIRDTVMARQNPSAVGFAMSELEVS